MILRYRLKKIQKKKSEIRAEIEKVKQTLRAKGIDVDHSESLLDTQQEEDILFND